MKTIKCTFVGSGAVGKTNFLHTLITGSFPHIYSPTIFDNFSKEFEYENHKFNIDFWDTGGNEACCKLRPLCYPNTDIFVICFSLVSYTELEDVEQFWVPEIQKYCPKTPYILLGIKSDIRDDLLNHIRDDWGKVMGYKPIPTEVGEELKRKISALEYIETSPLHNYNVNETAMTICRCCIKN